MAGCHRPSRRGSASGRRPDPRRLEGSSAQRRGHNGYLLGHYRRDGWWYFSRRSRGQDAYGLPPAPRWRNRRSHEAAGQETARTVVPPVVCALAILVVVLPSRITIGLRHVLPIYPFLSITAGFGLVALFRRGRSNRWIQAGAFALLLWFSASSAMAHPDYLAYFNELGGAHPERIVVDSDLDWGQVSLAAESAASGVGAPTGNAQLFRFRGHFDQGLPAVRPLLPYQPAEGWLAISEFSLTVGAEDQRKAAHRTIIPMPGFWTSRTPGSASPYVCITWFRATELPKARQAPPRPENFRSEGAIPRRAFKSLCPAIKTPPSSPSLATVIPLALWRRRVDPIDPP